MTQDPTPQNQAQQVPDIISSHGANGWYVRVAPGSRPGRFCVRGFLGHHYPDAVVHPSLEAAGDISGAVLGWESTYDSVGHMCLWIHPSLLRTTVKCWFVSVPGRDSEPTRTHHLVAFDTQHFPNGTVIEDTEFFSLNVNNTDQLGAIQVEVESGNVQQIYVRPDRRRSGVGTYLIYALDAFYQSNGWPGRVHHEGHRTAMGRDFVVDILHPQRIGTMTHLAPPMDEPE